MNELFNKLIAKLVILTILYYQVLFLPIISFTYYDSNKNYYYWLKPGVYFKYIVYGSDAPTIVIADKKNNTIYVTNYLLVKWIVLNMTDQYMFIEYSIGTNNATVFVDEKTILKNYSFEYKWKFVVKINTLDVYSVNSSNKPDLWIGEWFYLINNIQSSKKSLKLLYIRNSDFKCSLMKAYFRENELINFINNLNKSIVDLSNSTRFLEYRDTNSSIELTNKYISFIETNPPPNSFKYKVMNIEINENRIVLGKSHVSLYIPDRYIELFNTIYNASNRPIRFLTIKSEVRNYTLMVDNSGNTYCTIPPFITRVFYDNVTKVLLSIYGMIDNILYAITGFKTIQDTYIVPYYPSYYERGYLELIDTNIDFIEISSSERVLFINQWLIIIVLSILLVAVVYFVTYRLYKYRKY